MYYYIKGELVTATVNMAVIDAGGVGYKLTVSENTYRALPRRGEKPPIVTLYTYLSVREDGIELFGFESERELSSFKMLLSVSGVGPKAAMSILSLLTPEKFALAVCTEDKKAISKANGIGPKTAARIILELREKVEGLAQDTKSAPQTTFNKAANDAISVLVSLGLSQQDATARIETAMQLGAQTSEELINMAFRLN